MSCDNINRAENAEMCNLDLWFFDGFVFVYKVYIYELVLLFVGAKGYKGRCDIFFACRLNRMAGQCLDGFLC